MTSRTSDPNAVARIAREERALDNLSPACPVCGDLAEPDDRVCAACGSRLFPDRRELPRVARFVTTEIAGYLEESSTAPGVSVQIVDTWRNRRVCLVFRSEDEGRTLPPDVKVARTRERAARECERLNADAAL